MKISDIKKIKISRKQYQNDFTESSPDSNFPALFEFMNSFWNLGVSEKEFNQGIRLSHDNRKNFRDLFGRCSFTVDGAHHYHCWALDLGKAKLTLFAAKDHGTSYELITQIGAENVKNDMATVIRFYKMLIRLLPDHV